MTFSSKVKGELCKRESLEGQAELYGLLLFSKSFKFSNITFTTENKNIFERAQNLISVWYNDIIFDVVSPAYKKKFAFILNIPFWQDRVKILESLRYDKSEINLRIHKENINTNEKVKSFLKGAFLSCGTIIDPKTSYHIEFVVPYMNLANDLANTISEVSSLTIVPSVMERRGSYIVYMKGNDNIVSFLTYIEAPLYAMEVIQVSMLKEVRNYINRTTNFETANLSKTTSAAAIQIESIKKIQSSGVFETMDNDLKELAHLRLDNPDMSLRSLGENLSRPLSRSGVNHKIQKLIKIAESIE